MSERRIIKTFTLAGDPIKDIDGSELTELSLRKAKGKDLRAMDKVDGEIAAVYELLSRMAGVPVSSIDEMDVEDLMPITSWLQYEYLEKKAPAAGPTS